MGSKGPQAGYGQSLMPPCVIPSVANKPVCAYTVVQSAAIATFVLLPGSVKRDLGALTGQEGGTMHDVLHSCTRSSVSRA